MGKSNLLMSSRRDFITKIVPACSLMCIGGIEALAGPLSANGSRSIFQEKHMFDKEFPRKMTHREYQTATSWLFVMYAKAVEKELGKEKSSGLLKKMATEMNLERGKRQAKNSKDLSLKSYTRMFAEPKNWEGMLIMEIVEDTDTAFELKVSDCITAAVFRDADAAEIGHSCVCWGDYAWAEGFNPKIKLVRDKTLMQGDKYCNHRYIWTG